MLITVDAFRADVVGALGGPPGLTPHLDGLAGEAQLSTRAVSASAWTVPSMATIMTGLQPWRHGNWAGQRTVLREDLETLAEALRAPGLSHLGLPLQPLAREEVRLRAGLRRVPAAQGRQARARDPARARRLAAIRLGAHPAAARPVHPARAVRRAAGERCRRSAAAAHAARSRALFRSGAAAAG